MSQLTGRVGGPILKVASWNAHALFMYAFGGKARGNHKFRALRQLAHDHDVVLVQETHGEMGDLLTLPREFPQRLAVATFGPSAGVSL